MQGVRLLVYSFCLLGPLNLTSPIVEHRSTAALQQGAGAKAASSGTNLTGCCCC